MDKPTEPAGTSKRRRRRWPFIIVGIIVLIPLVLVAMAPRLLSTAEGNQLVASRLNKLFAPGHLKFKSIQFSWFAPTRLTNVALNSVIIAPKATISPSFWGFLVRPHELGTLSLENATFMVSRRPDGTIELVEALSGILEARDPLRDLTIRADDANLVIHDDFWMSAGMPDSMDLLVQLRPAPQWSTWKIDIERTNRESLKISGDFDRWATSSSTPTHPDLNLVISADRWPSGFHTSNDDRHASGDLIGKCEVNRSGGLWRFEGIAQVERVSIRDMRSLRVMSSGSGLELSVPLLTANWAVGQTKAGWKVERLDANSAIGSISKPQGDSDRLVGELDLAELSRRIPLIARLLDGGPSEMGRWGGTAVMSHKGLRNPDREPVRIEKGKARLVVESKAVEGKSGWSVEASLADLVARSGYKTLVYRDPATLSALVVPGDQGLTLDRLDLKTPFLDATVRGDVERGWELDGSLDLASLQRQFADLVDLRGVQLGGRSRLRGSSHYVGSSLEGMLGIDLSEVDCFGMKLDATPLVFRTKENKLTIDPIETKLNGGRLHIEPQIDLESRDGAVLRLGKGSTLDGALVNEEVSSRVLSYVAPVLNQTAHASGRVSVAVEQAEFPLGSATGRKANVTGKVVFQDLEFAPSPMIRMLLSAVSAEEPRSLRLDEPVLLSIADGRVNQRGLAIPIAGLTKLEIEGWVDFDRNMNLVATLPFTRELFGGQTVASNLLAGARVKLLITGTLGNPKLDKETLRKNIGEVRDTLLTNVAGNGVAEILRLLSKPRDPNAPPPLTAEERKAKRLEIRNERRKARGLDPLPQPPAKP
jgi:hypothetical protein